MSAVARDLSFCECVRPEKTHAARRQGPRAMAAACQLAGRTSLPILAEDGVGLRLVATKALCEDLLHFSR